MSTPEGDLADMIEQEQVVVGNFRLPDSDRMIIVKALRDRARWMEADVTSGERRPKASPKRTSR